METLRRLTCCTHPHTNDVAPIEPRTRNVPPLRRRAHFYEEVASFNGTEMKVVESKVVELPKSTTKIPQKACLDMTITETPKATQSSQLGGTSLTVLLFANPYYFTQINTQAWMESLNLRAHTSNADTLTPGAKIALGNQINSRHCMMINTIRDAKEKGITQVLQIADGLSPITIEMASRYPNLRFYCLDLTGMPQKQAFCSEQGLENVRCITADVTNIDDCLQKLSHVGFDYRQPALYTMMGIWVYLPKEVTNEWVRLCKNQHVKNEFLADFMLDEKDGAPAEQELVSGFVKKIEEQGKGQFTPTLFTRHDVVRFGSSFRTKSGANLEREFNLQPHVHSWAGSPSMYQMIYLTHPKKADPIPEEKK